MKTLISEVERRPILWSKWDIHYKNRVLVDKEWSELAELFNKDKEEVKAKWRNLRDQFQRELKKVKPPRTGNSIMSRYTGKWVHFQPLLFLRDNMGPNDLICPYTSNESSDISEETMPEILGHRTQELTNEDPRYPEITPNTEMLNYSHDPLQIKCKIEVFDPPEDDQPNDNTSEQGLQQKLPRRHDAYPKTTRGINKKTPKMTFFERQMLEMEKRKLVALTAKEKIKGDDDADDDLHFMKSLIPYLRKLNPVRKLYIRNEIQSLIIRELQDEFPDRQTLKMKTYSSSKTTRTDSPD